jgi:hypothetical protein
MRWFPFVHEGVLTNTWTEIIMPVFDDRYPVAQAVSVLERQSYFSRDESEGQALTSSLQHLDDVDIDNTINREGCHADTVLQIQLFNMERGVRWLEAATMLERDKADVIILNEMDIGMARSDQQHTARLLAQRLGMNYAWGLEFVELTQGTKEEQFISRGLHDFHGLHGNAVLSRCRFALAKIFRDPLGAYFSREPNNLNAEGNERRLGGRMALITQIEVVGIGLVTVGSLHKLQSEAAISDMTKFIELSESKLTILGGDQSPKPCENLKLTVHNTENSWPASCDTFGHTKGDIVCSNLETVKEAKTLKPCLDSPVRPIKLSDHAVISVAYSLV